MVGRLLRNIFATRIAVRRALGPDGLAAIEQAIRSSEALHSAQIQVVIDAGLSISEVIGRVSSRQKALYLFSDLRVWDTELNCGVLIYLLFAERSIEIVADRGIAAKVPQQQWEKICASLAQSIRSGSCLEGLLTTIGEVTALLKLHAPRSGEIRDELKNDPILV